MNNSKNVQGEPLLATRKGQGQLSSPTLTSHKARHNGLQQPEGSGPEEHVPAHRHQCPGCVQAVPREEEHRLTASAEP